MGPYCLADVTIVVDARITASAASVIAEAVHDRVILDFKPFVTDVVVHVDPDGSPQSHHMLTDEENASIGEVVNPEEVDSRVRQALLTLREERPDLPPIAEITSLQAYYFAEEDVVAPGSSPGGSQAPSRVDLLVSFRLATEDATIRIATLVAQAAKKRVLVSLPGIVRDVDMSLALLEDLDIAGQRDDPAPADAAGARPEACSNTEGWSADTCSRPASELSSGGGSRGLRPVTLIWDGGLDHRHTRLRRIR